MCLLGGADDGFQPLFAAHVSGMDDGKAAVRPAEPLTSLRDRGRDRRYVGEVGQVDDAGGIHPVLCDHLGEPGSDHPDLVALTQQRILGAADRLTDPATGGARLAGRVSGQVLYQCAERPSTTTAHGGGQTRQRRGDGDHDVRAIVADDALGSGQEAALEPGPADQVGSSRYMMPATGDPDPLELFAPDPAGPVAGVADRPLRVVRDSGDHVHRGPRLGQRGGHRSGVRRDSGGLRREIDADQANGDVREIRHRCETPLTSADRSPAAARLTYLWMSPWPVIGHRFSELFGYSPKSQLTMRFL